MKAGAKVPAFLFLRTNFEGTRPGSTVRVHTTAHAVGELLTAGLRFADAETAVARFALGSALAFGAVAEILRACRRFANVGNART